MREAHVHPYERLADLLAYPDDLATRAAAAREAVAPRSAEAAATLSTLVDDAHRVTPTEMEEIYTRTFDVQAPCCLEVGWQIFGDTYKRGSFLVRLRLAERDHDLSEGSELPDHLATVLRLLARLGDDEEPRSLVEEAVLPAVEKMRASLSQLANPYRAVLDAVATLLAADFAIDRAAAKKAVRHLPVAHSEIAP